jgi:hypothetical protein
MKMGDVSQVRLRLPKKIKKIYDQIDVGRPNQAIMDALEYMVMTPEWIDLNIKQLEAKLEFYKAIKDKSPLLETREFTPEENEWFQKMYEQAEKKGGNFLYKVRKGYNILIKSNLRLPEYKRVVNRWLKQNNLPFPENKK